MCIFSERMSLFIIIKKTYKVIYILESEMGVGDGRRTRKENILNPSLDNQGLKSMIIYSFFYYLSAVFMYLCMNVVRYWKDPTEEK